jgi:hypothetical protein
MRLTIDIDAKDLKRIQTLTGQRKKSPAISRALAAYLREREKQRFIERALTGQTDYSATNDELEAGDIYDAR